MKLFIKNMLSLRSKSEVKTIIEKVGLKPVAHDPGEVEINEKLSVNNYCALQEALQENDLELVNDKDIILIEKIKCLVIEMICAEELRNTNYSYYISKKLKVNYIYLCKIFQKLRPLLVNSSLSAIKLKG